MGNLKKFEAQQRLRNPKPYEALPMLVQWQYAWATLDDGIRYGVQVIGRDGDTCRVRLWRPGSKSVVVGELGFWMNEVACWRPNAKTATVWHLAPIVGGRIQNMGDARTVQEGWL